MRFSLPCDGAAGVSWSVVTAASLTSEGAGSDGGAAGGSGSGSDTITVCWGSVCSEGEETSMAEYRRQREGEREGR